MRPDSTPLSGLLGALASRGLHLALGVLAVGFVVFAGIDAARTRPSDGTEWLLGRAELQVLRVVDSRNPERTPLQPGDRILGIGHRLVESAAAAAEQLKRQPPGTSVSYLIERQGRQFEVPVPLAASRVVGVPYLVNVVLTLVYFTIGFLVYLRSRNERPARLFFLLCLLFGMYFMTNLDESRYFWGDLLTQNVGAFVRFFLPALFVHFFLVFPQEKRFLTRHPFLSPLPYLLPSMFYVRFTLDQLVGRQGASIGPTIWIVLGLYYVAGLVALLHGYFSYRDPLLRERVRILTVGTLVAVVPFLVFKIGLEELSDRATLAHLGVIPLAAIPVSFGYCVARYQVLQIDLLIKRSLLYGFLSALLLFTFLSVVLWIGGQALAITGTTSPLVSVGATLAIAAMLWPVRARLQAVLERRFYRSRTALGEVLEEIGREIPRIIQREQLFARVGERLTTVLEIPCIAFFLPAEDGVRWRCVERAQNPNHAAHAIGGMNPRQITLDEVVLDAIARAIQQRGEPFWVDADAEDPGLAEAITREQAELTARVAEQRELAAGGVALLVPLASGGRLVGLMALPAKQGREAYPLHELRLLTIVAGQMALQVENARLYEEEVTKQKLEEEMAMARAIQSRLLPARLPQLQGVDIHAANMSSKLVSGDYYDMIEREDGKLAVVIADVSGKGMPASLLASNLQAALRAQCDVTDSPGRILARINRQMHATTDPQHFATLFLLFLDPRTRRVVYSSGGHNAPVLLRADGTVELLEKGGLPLGAFDFGEYEEGEVSLEAGDLLFLYTDGLTETHDPEAILEYGEDRLNAFLREHCELTGSELIERLHEELRSFRGKVEPEDDITLICMKFTGAVAEATAHVSTGGAG
ncbi:MAG: SpoIIE family protein phosphatase [Candidatus Krumholzibacteriia bacterium]